ICIARRASLDRANGPRKTVVLGNGNTLFASAGLIRHVNSPIGCDFDVTVQSIALHECPHRNRNPERETTIVATRDLRETDVLRSVVDRVRIDLSVWSG